MASPKVTELVELFESEAARDRAPAETPDVGIVMGSDSDLDVMVGAYDALTELGFAEVTDYDAPPDARFTFETYAFSAHRTPAVLDAYAATAADRGLEVIIAAAGGKSADLPTMMASLVFPLPVIGVPVQEKSIGSVIGMPTGAPIVAVDAGKAYNAGLSAAQILAVSHDDLRERLVDYHAGLGDSVAEVAMALHEQGTPGYRERRSSQ